MLLYIMFLKGTSYTANIKYDHVFTHSKCQIIAYSSLVVHEFTCLPKSNVDLRISTPELPTFWTLTLL